ncbi:hypothetical protein [Haloprofundus halobius]|uniref:hypothetical protein n=1 Tax=Haloprofundus halobius TaxID=2876194 RepID=UPI001CD01373|nr:hypothetical protein [Haloprofundus halobius]
MIRQSRSRVPQDPAEWRESQTLEHLYVELRWDQRKIANHFDALVDGEEVTQWKVKWALRQRNIAREESCGGVSHGLARQLWEAEPEAVGGGR